MDFWSKPPQRVHNVPSWEIFYSEHLFSSSNYKLYEVPHPTISFHEHSKITLLATIPEIHASLFSFKPFKAPGPDGLHPMFFQKILLYHFFRKFKEYEGSSDKRPFQPIKAFSISILMIIPFFPLILTCEGTEGFLEK